MPLNVHRAPLFGKNSNELSLRFYHGNLAGAREHGYIVILHEIQETVEAENTAANLDGEQLSRGIQNTGPEDVAELKYLLLFLAEAYAHQHNLAVNGGLVSVVDNFYHVYELAELLDNLVELLACLVHVNGHTGESGVLARSHIERMDVVTAAGE